MHSSANSSISQRLTSAVLVAVLAATVLSAVAAAWRETERRFAARREALLGIASALASVIAPAAEREDRRGIAIGLNAIRSIPGIKFAIVVDARGRRLHEIGTGVVVGSPGTEVLANAEIGAFTSVRLGTYLVSAPVMSSGRAAGQLSLIADVSNLRTALIENLLEALLVGLAAAVVGIRLSARQRRHIAGPILSLTTTAEEIRRTADYSRSVPSAGTDETGRLVAAFNAMLSEIRARDAELRRQRDRLAEEVAERTRELETAKEAAERANAAKSQFLATMSHEIRTPMNGMLVMAELMAAESTSPKARRRSEVIVKSGHALLSLINDILDLSKIESGQLTLERIACDPASIMEDVLQLFAGRAAAGGLQLACHVAPDVPQEILGDPLRLGQVLSNLVNNALKFTEAGGVLVRLDVLEAGDCRLMRYRVTDTGIGIAEDKLGSLFEAFTQAEASTTRRYGGTGIGLTICRRLVTAMGGEIGVESRLGSGTTFTVTVPLEPAAATAVNSASTCVSAKPGGRLRLEMAEGPVRTSLALIASELDAMVQDAASVAADGDASPSVIVADAETLAAGARIRRSPGDTVLAVVKLGDTAGAQLLAGGTVQGLIEAPVGGRETRRMLELALKGMPLTEATPQPAAAPGRSDALSFAGARVLAADDSPVNREVLAEALGRLGVEVTSVDTGAAAVVAFEEGSFDLVLMDASMPEMDGFEATRRIRAIEARDGRQPLPIIALTAHVVGVDAEAWRSAGMSDYMTKPFTLADLRARLARWLGERPVRTEAEASIAVPTAAASGLAPILDASVLEAIGEMASPGDDLVSRILALYREHAPPLLDRLLGMAPTASADEIAEAAHALKSLSRNIGAVRVGDLCDEVEMSAREGGGIARGALAALPDALAGTLAAIANLEADERPVEVDAGQRREAVGA